MPGLRFKTDWVDADGIRCPELAATWASLEIRVDDSIVTRVLDTRARTVRNFVCVSLYPFAEWMATNWWFLMHEINNPAKEGDSGFLRRHAIGGDREGYAFPELRMVPQGRVTCLAWARDRSPWTSIEFLAEGEAWLDSGEVRAVCADFIDRVVRRLLIGSIDREMLLAEPARAPTPWAAGYRLAQEVRRNLDLGAAPLPSMARIAEAIGEEPALLTGVTAPVDLSEAALVDGVITRDDDRRPAFAFREFSREETQRFHFCRALAEALASPGTETLLTRAYSERQQRNRAFAAEFLAPSSGLRQRVSRPVVDGDDIDELAAAFGVSSWVIAHQIRNHRVAEVRDTGPAASPWI